MKKRSKPKKPDVGDPPRRLAVLAKPPREKPLFEDPEGPERYLSWYDHLPDGDENRNLNDSDFWHAVAMSKD